MANEVQDKVQSVNNQPMLDSNAISRKVLDPVSSSPRSQKMARSNPRLSRNVNQLHATDPSKSMTDARLLSKIDQYKNKILGTSEPMSLSTAKQSQNKLVLQKSINRLDMLLLNNLHSTSLSEQKDFSAHERRSLPFDKIPNPIIQSLGSPNVQDLETKNHNADAGTNQRNTQSSLNHQSQYIIQASGLQQQRYQHHHHHHQQQQQQQPIQSQQPNPSHSFAAHSTHEYALKQTNASDAPLSLREAINMSSQASNPWEITVGASLPYKGTSPLRRISEQLTLSKPSHNSTLTIISTPIDALNPKSILNKFKSRKKLYSEKNK
jgi:hypothetical protein